jgi:hypothetical protein
MQLSEVAVGVRHMHTHARVNVLLVVSGCSYVYSQSATHHGLHGMQLLCLSIYIRVQVTLHDSLRDVCAGCSGCHECC